jgi:hypothetical protein
LQGQTRSHGFFYRAESPDAGVFGLPLSFPNRLGWASPGAGSAAILFVRQQQMSLQPLGDLESTAGEQADGCRASCVDWYGDARPLFLADRVLALLGYEIVEGRIGDGAIEEHRRVNFAPLPSLAGR